MPITQSEFERLMTAIAAGEYTKENHERADELMCKVLRQFGYEAGVAVFENMVKWYA